MIDPDACPGSGQPPARPLYAEFPRGTGVCAGCSRNYSQNLDNVIIKHSKPGMANKRKKMREMESNNPFGEAEIKVRVHGVHLTGAQRKAIKAAYPDSAGAPPVSTCAVAEAVGEALGGVYTDRNRFERHLEARPIKIGSGRFVLNVNARPRFSVDHNGNLTLTVCLVEVNDKVADRFLPRWRITWRNKAIPRVLAEIAQAHDRGEDYRGTTRRLNISDAKIVRRVPQEDFRPERNEAKNNNPKGIKGKRVHRRPNCIADLDTIYA